MLKGRLIVMAAVIAAAAALAFLGSTDSGLATEVHDLALRKVTGDTIVGGGSECVVDAPAGCGYNVIVRNLGSAQDVGQVGVLVTTVGGCGSAHIDLHGGSASIGAVSGNGTSQLTVDVTLPANSQRTVNVGVTYPNCTPGAGTIDYQVSADICHSDDAGAGLFGSGACGAADDSHTDTNASNDAPVTKDIDHQ